MVIALWSVATLLTNPVAAGSYKIGVLAKDGAAKASEQWEATAVYLTASIPGEQFALMPLGFDEVLPAVESRRVEFFLANSSMFVNAQKKLGAEAIATMINSRQGKPLNSFGGVLFTDARRDDIQNIADLKGKRFMAVEASSFGGWQMAMKELVDHGIDPKKNFSDLLFGRKHENVVYAVQNGEADAGTVRTDTLERMAAKGDINLAEFKIINPKTHEGFPFAVSTRLYPEWPMAKRADVPADLAAKVAKALMALKPDSEAAKNAKVVGWSAPQDYAPVAELLDTLGLGDSISQ